MSDAQKCICEAGDIRRAIHQDGKRAGFESERARTWGWFIRVEKDGTSWWEWVRPCTEAEVLLFRRLFAEGEIACEPQETSVGMCILAA